MVYISKEVKLPILKIKYIKYKREESSHWKVALDFLMATLLYLLLPLTIGTIMAIISLIEYSGNEGK